ncbi:hypothetical protein [Enterobacter cloacae]|uniref:hypothetical protein n=1 Tax=Enterobacter cloacae TaxID=550 RepID=UPI0038901D84
MNGEANGGLVDARWSTTDITGNERRSCSMAGCKGRFFIGTDEKNCTVSAKALLKKGIHYALSSGCRWSRAYAYHSDWTNEMGYNRHRKI